MLTLEHVSKTYSVGAFGSTSLQAVDDVSFTVQPGAVVALIGESGSGKSTIGRMILGLTRITAGRIIFDGRDITGQPAYRRTRMGIALVPEGRRLFPQLTVEENLLVAGAAKRSGSWGVDEVLDTFPMLQPLRRKRAASLSGGEQQATAIGRALMTNPRLLLLDEVSLGLAPVAVEGLYRSLAMLIESGTTILLVEQDLARALGVAGRVVCMLEGRLVLEGAADELSREQVTDAYFGLRAAS